MTCLRLILSLLVLADVDPQAQQQFDQLFGARIRQVASTRGTRDDLELAQQLIAASTSLKDAPQVAAMALEKAVELSAEAPDGLALSLDAIDALSRLQPSRRDELAARGQKLLEQRFQRGTPTEKRSLAPLLAARYAEAGDARWFAGSSADALAAYRKALALPGLPPQMADGLKARVKLATETQRIDSRIDQLKASLARKSDPAASRELATLLLVEVDRMADALPHAQAAGDEALQQACAIDDKSAPEQLLAGARHLEGLLKAASHRGRLLSLRRAGDWYERFLKLHQKDDASKLLARSAMESVRAQAGKLALPFIGTRLEYEFATLSSLDDFVAQSSRWTLQPGAGLIATDESKGIHTKRQFTGDLRVSFTVTPEDSREIGIALTPKIAPGAKGPESLFFILHTGDDGQTTLLVQKPETAIRDKAFIMAGKPLTVSLQRRGNVYTWMVNGQLVWEGSDDRLANVPCHVYLYSHFSRKVFERLVVDGSSIGG